MPDDGGEGVVAGGGTAREYILDEDECPLSILMNHPARCEHLPITLLPFLNVSLFQPRRCDVSRATAAPGWARTAATEEEGPVGSDERQHAGRAALPHGAGSGGGGAEDSEAADERDRGR